MIIHEHYNQILFIFILIVPLWMSSCSKYSKEFYFMKFKQYIIQIDAKYTQYDKCKWDEIKMGYNNEYYNKVFCEFYQKDQKYIGELNTRYQKAECEYEIKNTFQTITDGILQKIGAI